MTRGHDSTVALRRVVRHHPTTGGAPGGDDTLGVRRRPCPSWSSAVASRGSLIDMHASSLLQSKLWTPATPEHHVRRLRLLQLVDDAVRAPLTVVAAPAGSGKTALLSGWAAESATPAAWLSLDETDRDPVQFWSGMIAAVETLMPGSGGRARRLLPRPDAPGGGGVSVAGRAP